jgi:Flp pilus assembly protein CpaB
MPGSRAAWIYVGCIIVAAATALGWRQHRHSCDLRRCWDLVPVLVASHPLTRGTRLTYDDLSQRAVPEQFVRRRDVRVDEAAALIGRTLVMNLEEGEPIVWPDVTVE